MERILQEVAYIAYHFHWSRSEILELPHNERHRWIEEISAINSKINLHSTPNFLASEPVDGGAPVSSEITPSGPGDYNTLSLDEQLELIGSAGTES